MPTKKQEDAAKEIDHSKTGPYSFNIYFEEDLGDAYVPAVKANEKVLTCAIDGTNKKKFTCTVTKEFQRIQQTKQK